MNKDPWEAMLNKESESVGTARRAVGKALTVGHDEDLVVKPDGDIIRLKKSRLLLIFDLFNKGEKTLKRVRIKSVSVGGIDAKILEQTPQRLDIERSSEVRVDVVVELLGLLDPDHRTEEKVYSEFEYLAPED